MAACIAALPSKRGRPPAQPLRLLYAGNIGAKQKLLDFCQLLSRSDATFELKIHGEGGEAEVVRKWIARSSDSRFSFGTFLDENGFARALHDTDLFVITESPGSGDSFIPSKLIPCIATGTPVLAVCDAEGPLGREVTESELGLRLDWAAAETDLAAFIEGAHSNSSQFRAWQANALDHSRQYSREAAISRMAALLTTMIGRTGDAVVARGVP